MPDKNDKETDRVQRKHKFFMELLLLSMLLRRFGREFIEKQKLTQRYSFLCKNYSTKNMVGIHLNLLGKAMKGTIV